MSEPLLLAPRYLGRFRCIGADCEDHCCAGWGGIDVDPPTAEAYRQLSADGDPRALQLNLVGHIQPNPEAWPDEGWPAALIPLETAKPCPFLSLERLCQIQGTLGEELLSSTCDTFPRQATLLDGQMLLVGRLSCPEVARLALLADDAMVMEPAAPDRRLTERGHFWVDEPWNDQPDEGDPRRQYHRVRGRIVALLQRRDYPFAARMLAVGLALSGLDGAGFRASDADATFDQSAERLPALVAWLAESGLMTPTNADPTADPSADTAADDAPRGPHRLLLRRVRRWIAMPTLPTRYRRCLERLRDGLGLPADATTPLDGALGARVTAAYATAQRQHLEPFLARHPAFFENLVLNHIWLGTFPYHPERSFAEEHALLAFRVGLMRLHLVGAAAAEGALTDDLAIETVQAFEKYADSHQFWERTMKTLTDEDALDPGSLAALLLA
jgi:lysine-N-methylase